MNVVIVLIVIDMYQKMNTATNVSTVVAAADVMKMIMGMESMMPNKECPKCHRHPKNCNCLQGELRTLADIAERYGFSGGESLYCSSFHLSRDSSFKRSRVSRPTRSDFPHTGWVRLNTTEDEEPVIVLQKLDNWTLGRTREPDEEDD